MWSFIQEEILGMKWLNVLIGNLLNVRGPDTNTKVGGTMIEHLHMEDQIAEALLAKGALSGTILSFMMAVTTLSLPSLIMLKKAIRRKLLGTFIAICTAWSVIVGYGVMSMPALMIDEKVVSAGKGGVLLILVLPECWKKY